MRSRYTAYTQSNVNYIFETMSGEALKKTNRQAVQQWAQQSEWITLEILATPPVHANGIEGEVEFKAYFKENGQPKVVHERSKFCKVKGYWFYIDGTHF